MGQRRQAIKRGLAILALVVVAGASSASEILPAEEQSAWNAVGRVNIAGLRRRGLCTGTLIAPDRVLTAAHCLYVGEGPRRVSLREVIFAAGWRQGEAAAHRKVSAIRIAPGFDPKAAPSPQTLGHDLAELTLVDPIPAEIALPLPTGPLPDPAGPLTILGYRHDREHILSRQSDCTLHVRSPTLLAMDCPLTQGTSGGPVLHLGPKGWTVVGVAAAASDSSGNLRSFAAVARGLE